MATEKIKVYRVDDGDYDLIYEDRSGAMEHIKNGFDSAFDNNLENDGDDFGITVTVEYMTRKELDNLTEI